MLLIAFGFASLGMAITSYMKTFQQMDWINFVLLPMFLFSATFYPITVYPESIQWIDPGAAAVARRRAGPRPHDRRSLGPRWGGTSLYFVVMIAVGLVFTTKRLRALFLD